MTIRVSELRSPQFGEPSPRQTREGSQADFAGILGQKAGKFGASGSSDAQDLRPSANEGRRGKLNQRPRHDSRLVIDASPSDRTPRDDKSAQSTGDHRRDQEQAVSDDPSQNHDQSLSDSDQTQDQTSPSAGAEHGQSRDSSATETANAETVTNELAATSAASEDQQEASAPAKVIANQTKSAGLNSIDSNAASGASADSNPQVGSTGQSSANGNGPFGMALSAAALARSIEDDAAKSDGVAGKSAATNVSSSTHGSTGAGQRGIELLQGLTPANPIDAATGNTAATATAIPMPGTSDSSEASDAQAANAARVARALHGAINQNGGSVTIRLTPPELGFVRVQVELRDGAASVQFQSDQESARGLLSNQLGALRGALERQGLTIARLEVQPLTQPMTYGDSRFHSASDDGRSRGGFTEDQSQRQHRRPTDAERNELDAAFSKVLVNTVA